MGLSYYEQETNILFNREEDSATLYTSDPTQMTRLDKLVSANGTDFKLIEEFKSGGKVVGKTYSFPKRFVSIRTKDVKRNLTDEQRAAMSERMRKMRESNNG